MMPPIFRRESKIKKGDFKTIWFLRTPSFRVNVQFISVHMQGEGCKVRLMSMTETYAVIHHHNKAQHNYQEFQMPVGLTQLQGNKLFGLLS